MSFGQKAFGQLSFSIVDQSQVLLKKVYFGAKVFKN
jgi:hypothetical protein